MIDVELLCEVSLLALAQKTSNATYREHYFYVTIGVALQKETQHAGHIPSNLSRIYVQPVIENMESNQHNPRIWNPNFETQNLD